MMHRLPHAARVGYASGSIATGLYSTVPSVLLLFYLTDTLGVPAAWASLVIFIPKLWSLFADPMAGKIADGTWRGRSLRPIVLAIGAVGMPISFAALFGIASAARPGEAALVVGGLFFLSITCYSAFSVPYVAIPSLLLTSERERSALISLRMGFAIIGILLGSAVAPLIIGWAGEGVSGYRVMGLAAAAAAFFSMMIATYAARRLAPWFAPRSPAPGWRAGVRHIVNADGLLRLTAIYVLIAIALSSFTAAIPYHLTHVLRGESSTIGLLFLIMLGTAFLTLPLWHRLALMLGTERALALGLVALGIGMSSLALAQSTSAVPATAVVIGFGFAATQALPFAICADLVSRACTKAGVAAEALMTGFWTSCEKIGLALGAVIVGIVLSTQGFLEGGQRLQSAQALDGIRIAIGAVPAVLLTIAALVLVSRAPRSIRPIEDRAR